MSRKISLWVGTIGLGLTVTLLQPIANAQSSVDVANSARSIDPRWRSLPEVIAIARGRRGSGDNFGSAMQKYQQGDYQGALADYNRAIKNNPQSPNAYYNRGLLKADKLQDFQGALADYNRAIKLKPNYDAAYNNRGNLKADKLQDYQGALLDYNRAIKLKPRNASSYYNRGILKYTYLKDSGGGIADLQQAAKLAQRQGNTQETQAANDLLNQWQQTTGK
jgi:tetratricopeptide (TPR) repeat protein